MIATFLVGLAVLWLAVGLVAWGRFRHRGWHREVLATGLYLPAVAGFFWQLVFLPGVVVPRGGGDLASFLYPVYSFAARSWQQGVVPLWNPHLYGGSPFLADMQTGNFYPPNLMAFLAARPFTYEVLELLAVGHYVLAAIFAYAYARTLGLGRGPAWGSGLVFAFSGFMVAHLGHLNMLEVATWLPLVLLAFHRALQGNWKWAVASGAALGLSILPGHSQMSLYFALFLLLYWLWALVVAGRAGWRPWAAASLPIAGAVALALAAVQLVPTAELIPHTVRAGITYPQAAEYAHAPASLLMLLVPHFFGSSPAAYWGIPGNLTELYGYAGLLPLVLALLAVVVGRRTSPWIWFFALTTVLFLLLSLGGHTILHGWLYRFVPGFDKVRAAGRFMLFFNFGVAVLAGFGLERLGRQLRARERPYWRWLMRGLAVVLAAGALVAVPLMYRTLLDSLDKDPAVFDAVREAIHSLNLNVMFLALAFAPLLLWRYRPSAQVWVFPLAVGLVVLDLFSNNAGYNPTTEDVLAGYHHPQAVEYLRREAQGFRLDTMTGVWAYWQPDLTLLEGIDDLMGIHNPMQLADYAEYWESLGSRSVPGYDLLNAKFVVGAKDVPLDWAKFEPAFTDDPLINLYRNRRVLPRALVVPGAEVVPREQILARLRSPEFDPGQMVLLEAGQARKATETSAGEVLALQRPNGNEVVVAVNATAPGYLLLLEMHYPGWRAFVDSQERPLLRANYVFRAVQVEPGQHQVRFAFQPRSWQLGLGISLAAAAGLLVLAGLVAWKRV